MILGVLKCRNSSLDYDDTVNKFIEEMMEQSIMTKSLMNTRKSYQTIQDIGQRNVAAIRPCSALVT